MVVIGSTALRYWFPDFKREPKDRDFLLIGSETGYDYVAPYRAEFLRNPVLEKWVIKEEKYPSPSLLYTLKASHLSWNINWEKHMFDFQFMKNKGCVLNEELFWQLYEHWSVVHGQNKRSDLKMSKEDFFDNNINYDSLEHDKIHLLLNPDPIYSRILKDHKEVELDHNKWDDLSHEDQLNMIREEVMVMAWERYKNIDYRIAYHKMLKKFIISHCPLFALIFTIENYVELHKPKFNFYKTINDGIKRNQQPAL